MSIKPIGADTETGEFSAAVVEERLSATYAAKSVEAGLTSEIANRAAGDAARYTKTETDSRYLRALWNGSSEVRSMVEAGVTADTPTLTASTTAPAAYTVTKRLANGNTNYWSSFRCSGAPMVSTASTAALPRGATKTNASTVYWGGCSRVEFDLIGDGFVFTMQAIASSAYFKIWIDGQPHSLTAQAVTSVSGASSGSTNHVTVAFGASRRRRIVLEWTMTSASPATSQGIRVKPTVTILPPSIPSPRFMVIHDSYGFGVGASGGVPDGVMNAWPIHLGRLLGFSDIWNFTAVPSTGVLKTDPTNFYGAYSSRFTDDVIPNLRAGDILLYMGSVNDGAQAAGATQTQAIADLTTLKAALPDVKIIVGSPLYTAAPSASHTRVRDEMQAAATATGLAFANAMDTTANLFNGTGYVGGTIGDGNSDVNSENNNGIHPSLTGAKALAYALKQQIAPLLGQAA